MARRRSLIVTSVAAASVLAACNAAPASPGTSASAAVPAAPAPSASTAPSASLSTRAPAPSASSSAAAPSPPKRSIAEMKADALAHRADYDGKSMSIDGYFVKREQVHHGSGEHPRYVFHDALVADSADPATHADKNNLLRCELGENFPAFKELEPVTIQGTAQVDSTVMLYDKNELRLEGCTIKKRSP